MIVIFPAPADSVPPRRGMKLLLDHCAAFDLDRGARPTARERLEALLGADLTRRLLRLASVYGPRSGDRG